MPVASSSGDPLRPGASPHDIRAALLPEDRVRFDVDCAQSPADSQAMLERWRRMAVVQRDPQEFRRMVRRAAELWSGEPVPADEPLAVTRARVGM